MSFIIGGVVIAGGLVYLIKDTFIKYLYPKPIIEPVFTVSRTFQSMGGYLTEFGILDGEGQFFRLIEGLDSVMIPPRKLLECTTNNDNKIEYKFELGYTITILNHAHHMIILIKYENLVILDLMIDKDKPENIYKKIDNHSTELDYLESFFTVSNISNDIDSVEKYSVVDSNPNIEISASVSL